MAIINLRKFAYKYLGIKSARAKKPFKFIRQETTNCDAQKRTHRSILNLLNYTKTSGSSYAALDFPAGYHEISIGGTTFAGQRKPQTRIDISEIDFNDKSVLDIGCNQGGMLFALREKIKWGVGVDFDYRMINACNAITAKLDIDSLDFYVFDIDKDPHSLLEDFLPDKKVDVIFLLAVCMWVDRWRALIDKSCEISGMMLFESNGSTSQQDEQYQYLLSKYESVRMVSDSSEDDPKQKRRRLYVCQ